MEWPLALCCEAGAACLFSCLRQATHAARAPPVTEQLWLWLWLVGTAWQKATHHATRGQAGEKAAPINTGTCPAGPTCEVSAALSLHRAPEQGQLA